MSFCLSYVVLPCAFPPVTAAAHKTIIVALMFELRVASDHYRCITREDAGAASDRRKQQRLQSALQASIQRPRFKQKSGLFCKFRNPS